MARTIVFDAVGTLLKPNPDVVTAYHAAGSQFGSQLTPQQVASQFKLARRTFFSCDTPAEKTTAGSLFSSDSIEYELWQGLVCAIFSDIAQPLPLFEQLWEHFASPANWELYDDVVACLDRLHTQGDHVIIASNFDSRLHEIVASLPDLKTVAAVHCSAEVGFRKPDPEFYRSVGESIPDDNEVIMIGDDLENDCRAPVLFGWQGIYLDRNDRSTNLPGDRTIDSLSQPW